MTTTTISEWNALVATHKAALAAEIASNDPNASLSEAEHDLIDGAEWQARKTVLHAPAPDLNGMAYKLWLLVDLEGSWAGDQPDNLAFLQRLLDDDDIDGGFPIVRLLQDCLRLAGVDSPILALTRSEDKQWPELVEAFKEAHAYINRPGPDEVTEEEAANFGPIRDALYVYPVANLAELREKLALIKSDDGGDDRGFKAIAEDIERLSGIAA
ncbi:hypothetical protein [Brevundimonas goettingensis]|uniref:Uncharacterized protein n=1 Tax=Brevundimonas goettingensis TaxID=2774190 RepID=A0A975BZF3_9CAUL|nr:hypothetical protein [Brevundimonas goettingensis]QTC90440.1 hypothetical protein IFJ75_14305 [Brevundimonas goettingensis]